MTATWMDEAQIEEEVGFIERQQIWPMWPLLPVKHVNRGDRDHPKDEEVGIMVGSLTNNIEPTVYLINLYSLKKDVSVGEQLQGVRTLEFESITELVRAGWIGD